MAYMEDPFAGMYPPSDDEYSNDGCDPDMVDSAGNGFDNASVFRFENVAFDNLHGIATFTYQFCKSERFVARTHLPQPWPPAANELLEEDLFCALFHVGLAILPWFWMGFACRRVVISAGYLNQAQVQFWEEFYRNVLAEFFYLNDLGPDRHIRLEVVASPGLNDSVVQCKHLHADEVLCCLGGGKDSLVVFELMRRFGRQPRWLYVGDGVTEFEQSWRLPALVNASGSSVAVASHELSDKRWQRQRLRALEPEGHPWAALVAMTAAVVAIAHGVGVIAVGNERSAAVGNGVTDPGGLEVNHQHDKSFAFEHTLRKYLHDNVAAGLIYFSPLQPLWEVQIARAFCCQSATKKYLPFFLSCNEPLKADGSRPIQEERGTEWCGKCAKCCFVYLMLAAWLTPQEASQVFSQTSSLQAKGNEKQVRGQKSFATDLFTHRALLPQFASLLGVHDKGLDGHKPFECVGTEEEAAICFRLSLYQRWHRHEKLPHVLSELAPALIHGSREIEMKACVADAERHLKDWDHDVWLPEWLPKAGRAWFVDDSGRDLLHDTLS